MITNRETSEYLVVNKDDSESYFIVKRVNYKSVRGLNIFDKNDVNTNRLCLIKKSIQTILYKNVGLVIICK